MVALRCRRLLLRSGSRTLFAGYASGSSQCFRKRLGRRWVDEAIEDTEHVEYFVKGKPAIGWQRGWLRRIEFGTRVLRPLEQTRHEWFTPKNLATFFEVARCARCRSGNSTPSLRSASFLFRGFIITHPERICSYDETKMELDCIKGGARKRDRFVKPNTDDGETMVTKSRFCASAACGRLGDGNQGYAHLHCLRVR